LLQHAPTTAGPRRAAELDWPVETVPAFADVDGSLIPAPEARHVIRRTRAGAEVLGTVGKRWTPLQNRDAFRWFDPLLADGDCELEAAGSLKGGRNVWILARVRSIAPVTVGRRPDDEVRPYLLLSNAHDGTRAVTCAFTPIRVVCWNTLSAAHSVADRADARAARTSVSIRH